VLHPSPNIQEQFLFNNFTQYLDRGKERQMLRIWWGQSNQLRRKCWKPVLRILRSHTMYLTSIHRGKINVGTLYKIFETVCTCASFVYHTKLAANPFVICCMIDYTSE